MENIWVGHGAGDMEAPMALSIFDGTSQWVTISKTNTPLVENACYAIEFGEPGVAWLGLKNQGLFEFNYNGTPFDTGDDTYTRRQSEHLPRYRLPG